MKAPIKRPFKRHVVAVSSLLILSGCSGIQSNSMYQSWEKRAYDAYNIAVPPVKDAGVLPALMRTVALPGKTFIRNPSVQRVSYRNTTNYSRPSPVKVNPGNASSAELDFIERNYGL